MRKCHVGLFLLILWNLKYSSFFVLFQWLTTLNHDKVICYAKKESVLTLLNEMVVGLRAI